MKISRLISVTANAINSTTSSTSITVSLSVREASLSRYDLRMETHTRMQAPQKLLKWRGWAEALCFGPQRISQQHQQCAFIRKKRINQYWLTGMGGLRGSSAAAPAICSRDGGGRWHTKPPGRRVRQRWWRWAGTHWPGRSPALWTPNRSSSCSASTPDPSLAKRHTRQPTHAMIRNIILSIYCTIGKKNPIRCSRN